MKRSRTAVSLVVLAAACVAASSCGSSSPTEPDPAAAVAPKTSAEGLTVTASNNAPVMNLRTTPRAIPGDPHPVVAGPAPLTVKFNLCNSSDPDQNPEAPELGDTLNWQFHFGEGGQAFGPDGTFNPDAEHRCRTEHTYARPGRYVATVSVTDKHLEDQSLDVVALARVTERLTIEVGPELPGGGEAAPPPCGGDGECTVFITSSEHDGNLGGLSGADAICQDLATAAGLSGVFQAWLSDSTKGPATRFASRAAARYLRVDGMQVASDWNDLTDGVIDSPISLTEVGAPTNVRAWTNTRPDGTPSAPWVDLGITYDSCNDWTDASAVLGGRAGFSLLTDGRWTEGAVAPCSFSASHHLYCFEQ